MEVWIVGQAKDLDTSVGDFVHDWEFQGVFDDKGKAESACVDKNYFMFPVEINQEFPQETAELVPFTWPAR